MEATENLQSADDIKHTLVAKGLKKHYGSRQVVKGVDLSVKSGEVVGLLGPNGAGKTTTFYMVVGLVVADDGTIELDGKSIIHQPIYRRARMGLSYLPQEASVFRKLTVEDNIRGLKSSSTSFRSSTSVRIRRSRFQAANAAARKSPVRLPQIRDSFCSTNRLPASTRSP